MPCPFCSPHAEAIVWQSETVIALRDTSPVSPGHTLVLPRRHVQTYFDATAAERAEIWQAVEAVKVALDAEYRPDGYNVGFNSGRAAGQTVMHLHVHVIPRYEGDVADPRGGVRHVFPDKGNYLAGSDELGLSRGLSDPFAPHLHADLDRARHADLAVAFIMMSGLTGGVLRRLEAMLERAGSRVRILAGDYQGVTEPAALRELLNLQEQVEARTLGLHGTLQLRVFETVAAYPSFHPKAYLMYAGEDRQPFAAYVGSSNLTHTALNSTAVEWNLRFVDRNAEVQASFEALFGHAQSKPLTRAWVRAYEARRVPPQPGQGAREPLGVVEAAPPDELALPAPEPHVIQGEALDALEATREAGNQRGLVVLATGLGKTWLSAFDSTRERGFRRVLFVAHRDEILRQAVATFAKIRPGDSLGLYTGTDKDPDADVVFASVATLGRAKHLEVFASNAFDYVVVDEFHHACASTYRALLCHFEPKFLLGLTATPERSDGGDLLGLCHENLVYECRLAEGINRGLLCPFHYFGVPDDVQYDQIPWKSRKFDDAKLTEALATNARAGNALQQLRARGGNRTLGFCVSQRHADFMKRYFVEHSDFRVAAVHSGANSDPRQTSIERLQAGELDILFCVDMFNEGLDVPTVDTVLMLRPTESKILWLQQLGRGLRKADGKSHLRVIDYIGNHRVFLNKPEALLAAFGKIVHTRREVARILRAEDYELPEGCAVTYDVQALEILDRLYPPSKGAIAIREWYEEFRDVNGQRPTALEAFHCGYNPAALRPTHDSWFAFVGGMGDLSATEHRVLQDNRAMLVELETSPTTKSDKVILMQALLELGQLPGTASIAALTDTFIRLAGRSAALRRDVSVKLEDRPKVEALLRKSPIAAWVKAKDGAGRPLFVSDAGDFGTGPGVVQGERETVAAMCAELLDWRQACSLDEARMGVRFRVLRNSSGNPILKIDRKKHELPDGWAPVTIGEHRYQANFVKHFVNVVRAEKSEDNVLPALMRRWFGDGAGQPGTTHSVAQDRGPGGGYVWTRADAQGPDVGTQVRGNDGEAIDARLRVEERDGTPTIVFMSRGGGRNDAYALGLELVLGRLAAMGAVVERIAVDTGETKQLSVELRTLDVSGAPYPLDVAAAGDVSALRKRIGRAAAAVGRAPGSQGSGNATKRLRIWVARVELAAVERVIAP